MLERYYVLTVKLTSKGTEDRVFTPYDNLTTATRKFHEALCDIGAGPQRICVALLDTYLNTLERESWIDPNAQTEG